MMDVQRSTVNQSEFAKQAEGRSRGFFTEFGYFLLHNKKWWLIPVFLALLVLSSLVMLGGTAVAPFIYTLF
jgi:hypothetical protein